MDGVPTALPDFSNQKTSVFVVPGLTPPFFYSLLSEQISMFGHELDECSPCYSPGEGKSLANMYVTFQSICKAQVTWDTPGKIAPWYIMLVWWLLLPNKLWNITYFDSQLPWLLLLFYKEKTLNFKTERFYCVWSLVCMPFNSLR